MLMLNFKNIHLFVFKIKKPCYDIVKYDIAKYWLYVICVLFCQTTTYPNRLAVKYVDSVMSIYQSVGDSQGKTETQYCRLSLGDNRMKTGGLSEAALLFNCKWK